MDISSKREDISNYYGLSPLDVRSNIISEFVEVGVRRGIIFRGEAAEMIGGFATHILDHTLGGRGAGRREESGRRYREHERNLNLNRAQVLARKVAVRVVERAREGHAVELRPHLVIRDNRIRYEATVELLRKLCPPPLPPLC